MTMRPTIARRLLRRRGDPRGSSRAHRGQAEPPEGRWVAAVVTDDLDAVGVARTAGGLAREGDGRLLLLVPQPGRGFATEPMVSVMVQRWREEAARAIVGRILPVLEDPTVPLREVRVQVVPHGAVSWPGRRRDGEPGVGPAARAVLSAARRAGVDVLVGPTRMLPALARDDRPLLVHVDRPRVTPTSGPLTAPNR